MRAAWLLLAALLGCSPPAARVAVKPEPTGLRLSASVPMDAVRVRDVEGSLVIHQPLPEPSEVATITARLAPGRYTVEAAGVQQPVAIPDVGDLRVSVEAPVGQGRRPVVDGEKVDVGVLGQDEARAAVILTAERPTRAEVRSPEGVVYSVLQAPGERAIVSVPLGERPVPIAVVAGGRTTRWTLVPHRIGLEEARDQVRVEAVRLPTDPLGATDRARPPDRVTLPSAWWRQLLRRAGLGYRPRDDQAPWTWQSVDLENRSEAPVHLLVRSVVLDADGTPAEAFRPRLRESVGESVQVLIRVPPGKATASLPLYVDGSALPDHGRFTRRITVLPLGGDTPLHTLERPLWVSRGSAWASGWLVAALGASTVGWLWLLLGAPRWIARARTGDLVTIAQFASVTWVAGTALQVAGLGVSAVLGPFSPLLTGLADDVLRACLLGTLVVLVPRPGTAALATAVGFVMRGLTMGTFHPVDLLYLGSAVFWLESWLWLAGCTRGTDWRDGRLGLWLRLCLGLGVSNVCATATALVVSVVFYRLYFADWYVGLILALPGFLYVCLGCGLAVGFSRALREVGG